MMSLQYTFLLSFHRLIVFDRQRSPTAPTPCLRHWGSAWSWPTRSARKARKTRRTWVKTHRSDHDFIESNIVLCWFVHRGRSVLLTLSPLFLSRWWWWKKMSPSQNRRMREEKDVSSCCVLFQKHPNGRCSLTDVFLTLCFAVIANTEGEKRGDKAPADEKVRK